MNRFCCILLCLVFAGALEAKPKIIKKITGEDQGPSALDQYIAEAHRRAAAAQAESPGSLFSSPATMTDLAADVKARNVDDLVTIVVNEQASAVTTGETKTSRASSANAAITSAAGALSSAGRLANLLNANSNQSLTGDGTTSRTTTLTTTLSARVVDVLPNGYLVIAGSKTTMVNSENQVITLRGVIRPNDLSNANTVVSGNIAQMELKINGKGVVNDAIRRPNFLYRLLLGLLPF
ncbi:MAG TPA: flagellar basal body L-ring protein FlgH [Bryobacteraceae bacterium]|jgi:flagellar L-ring protein precursor FlgH|nr:flagellar basal body L-ring protein FlgH [Bryobacteraceae bacterium]